MSIHATGVRAMQARQQHHAAVPSSAAVSAAQQHAWVPRHAVPFGARSRYGWRRRNVTEAQQAFAVPRVSGHQLVAARVDSHRRPSGKAQRGGARSSASSSSSTPSLRKPATTTAADVARKRRAAKQRRAAADSQAPATARSGGSSEEAAAARRARSKAKHNSKQQQQQQQGKDKRDKDLCVVAVHYGKKKGHLGPFYTSVADLLVARRGWRLKDTPIWPYDLVLGESIARGIPFNRLTAAGFHRGGRRPLVNFYRNFKALTWKVEMVQTLDEYCRAKGLELNLIVPASFTFFPSKARHKNRRAFTRTFNAIKKTTGRHTWIVKPSGGGKGMNIVLMDNTEDIFKHLDSSRGQRTEWVVQLYIDKPLLLRGNRKFDMRLWVLLDHKYHVHLYRQGVLRTGSTPFSMDDLGDRYVHLSNHCIQKNHPLYGKYEPTNEMWYHEFTLYLQEAYGVDFEDEIMPQIRELTVLALEAARGDLALPKDSPYQSFNLLGFDFMIDADCKVWLVEVNSSPGVAQRLHDRMAKDLVTSAIDPVYVPHDPRLTPHMATSRAAAAAGDGTASPPQHFTFSDRHEKSSSPPRTPGRAGVGRAAGLRSPSGSSRIPIHIAHTATSPGGKRLRSPSAPQSPRRYSAGGRGGGGRPPPSPGTLMSRAAGAVPRRHGVSGPHSSSQSTMVISDSDDSDQYGGFGAGGGAGAGAGAGAGVGAGAGGRGGVTVQVPPRSPPPKQSDATRQALLRSALSPEHQRYHRTSGFGGSVSPAPGSPAAAAVREPIGFDAPRGGGGAAAGASHSRTRRDTEVLRSPSATSLGNGRGTIVAEPMCTRRCCAWGFERIDNLVDKTFPRYRT